MGSWVLLGRPDLVPPQARAGVTAFLEQIPLPEVFAPAASVRALVPTDTLVVGDGSLELAVLAQSGSGEPLPDTVVRFVLEGGEGVLVPEEAWTDHEGVARASLILRGGSDDVVVRAALAGAGGRGDPERITVARSHRSEAPDPGAIRMEYVQGDGQETDPGMELPERFSIRILDAEQRPVEGVEVRFEVTAGGGVVVPSAARTDPEGRASTNRRLGPRPGFHRLSATAAGVAAPVTFTAIGRGAVAASTDAPPVTPDSASSPPAEPVAPPPGETTAAVSPPPVASGAGAAGGGPVPGPASVPPVVAAVGGSTICALADGRVDCRGSDDRGQRLEGGAPGTRAIAAGLFHACALDASGTASCWGANEAGQLGDGSRVDRDAPVAARTEYRFARLSAGVSHTCGLAAGGWPFCWGRNVGGQLGDGTREDRPVPTPVAGSRPFEQIVAGWNHTCGVTADGAAHCWGLNRDGQVGDGTTLDRLSPREVLSPVRSLAAGSAHTCAIARGRVLCWGANDAGQLGDGTTTGRATPEPAEGLPGVATALVAGAAHTCALLADGTTWCWGQNLHGQLGDGSTVGSEVPVRVSGAHRFRELRAGGAVTCGTTVDGDEYCWGLNQSGQLGDGTRTNRSVPVRVDSGG